MATPNSEGGAPIASEHRERKRKRGARESQASSSRWRNAKDQQIYSSKLLEALRRVRRATPGQAKAPRSRAVRDAAYRVLAVAGRGQMRWSRAILSGRSLLLKVRKVRIASRCRRVGAPSLPAKKRSQPLQRKTKILGRLVPGCGKLSLPNLLDEASDYIAALEMQVRSMSALADILSASSIGTPAV